MSILRVVHLLFRALFRHRSQLALENLALRQQLAILRRKVVRPRLRHAERAFWVILARVWDQWRAYSGPRRSVIPGQGDRSFRAWWPRRSPCASPQTLIRGQPGVKVDPVVHYQYGRRHLPIISLERAA